MMSFKNITLTAVSLGVLGSWPLAAHEGDMPMPKPATAEFNQVKQLAGKWAGTMTHPGTGDKPASVTTEFRVTAAGSAVEEILMGGTPHEMVDMYSDEDGKLGMIHYCAIGNHPHMRLKATASKAITLEMGPTPGIDPAKDPHMHALALEFPDANHLTERWTSYKDGKAGESVVFKLTRVP